MPLFTQKYHTPELQMRIIIIIIIEGLSLLQSIPPTTADKQTQAQKCALTTFIILCYCPKPSIIIIITVLGKRRGSRHQVQAMSPPIRGKTRLPAIPHPL